MLLKLREYISVRDNDSIIQKIDSGTIKNLSYKHKSFKNGQGLVITKSDFHSHESKLSMTHLVGHVNEWVKVSMVNGVELEQIMLKIQKMHKIN